jgi:hypothetical protein
MKNNPENLTLNTYLISGFFFGGLIGFVSTGTFVSVIIGALIGLAFGAIFNKIPV